MKTLASMALAPALALLAACAPMRTETTIPTATIAGPASDHRVLVVVLPGRRDSLEDLRRLGVADAIHAEWPRADVLLTDTHLGYYVEGRLSMRLRDEIVAPARASGYDRVWIAGASLGGLGAVDYAVRHPGGVDGLLLLAPYLGEGELVAEIAAAGGVRAWNPGPHVDATDAEDAARNVWRGIRAWATGAAPRPAIRVACGEDDPLRRALPLLAPVVGADRVRTPPGGHKWVVWLPALRAMLRDEGDRT